MIWILLLSIIYGGTQSPFLDVNFEKHIKSFVKNEEEKKLSTWIGVQRQAYKKNKLELRDKSLELNSFRLQTCHIVMGGVDTGIEERQNWVKPKKIAEMIKWVTEQDTIKIPIIGIDQPKQPW